MSVVKILEPQEKWFARKAFTTWHWTSGEIWYIFFDFNGLIYYRHLRLPPNEENTNSAHICMLYLYLYLYKAAKPETNRNSLTHFTTKSFKCLLIK